MGHSGQRGPALPAVQAPRVHSSTEPARAPMTIGGSRLRGMRGGSRARRGAPVLTSRARIHFAALNQFAAHGYAGTTLRAIATEAG